MGDVIAIFNINVLTSNWQVNHIMYSIEDNGICIDDRSISRGGKQCIATPEGYIIPHLTVYSRFDVCKDKAVHWWGGRAVTCSLSYIETYPGILQGMMACCRMITNGGPGRLKLLQTFMMVLTTAGNYIDGTVVNGESRRSIHIDMRPVCKPPAIHSITNTPERSICFWPQWYTMTSP